jgi:hypothetical protein
MTTIREFEIESVKRPSPPRVSQKKAHEFTVPVDGALLKQVSQPLWAYAAFGVRQGPARIEGCRGENQGELDRLTTQNRPTLLGIAEGGPRYTAKTSLTTKWPS